MFRKNLFLLLVAVTFAAVGFLSLKENDQAFAQEAVSPKEPSCIGCHEDQYTLYDNGKWYCLRKSPVSCTECHGGRTDTVVQDMAHEGLIANPLVDNAAVCQDCHPNDYQARVQKFASIAGVSSTPRPYATYTPSALISYPVENAGGTRQLRALPPGAWQVAGISLLGIAFLVIFLFACRCWKIDRLCQIERQEGG